MERYLALAYDVAQVEDGAVFTDESLACAGFYGAGVAGAGAADEGAGCGGLCEVFDAEAFKLVVEGERCVVREAGVGGVSPGENVFQGLEQVLVLLLGHDGIFDFG